MSLYSAITKLEPIVEVYDKDVIVKLIYNGHTYHGCAFCHKEDEDFFSEKVGATIAHYRAMISIYEDEIKRAEMAAQVLWSAYKDVIYNSQKEGTPVDPTGAFARRTARAEALVKKYKTRQDILRTALKKYIKDHEKCLANIRAWRAAQKNEDKIV